MYNAIKMCSMKSCVFIVITIYVTCIDRSTAKYTHNIKYAQNISSIIQDVTPPITEQDFSGLKLLQQFRWNVKRCIESAKGTIWKCFKTSSLTAFDALAKAAVIPVSNGIRFVRNIDAKESLIENDALYQGYDMQYSTWFDLLAMRLAKVLHTHVLQINLKQVTDAYISTLEKKEQIPTDTNSIGTARLRRHRYNMIITMMFGVVALGAVLVPLGFQMLSIVSGKALLLAKMALLLASINGLKRVANSGVHYGLYQVPGEHYGYYDRNDPHHPRNVASIAVAQPIEFGIRK